MKHFEKTRDMTNGTIIPKLLLFAFPIMFSSLFNLVYSLTDTIIVGRFIGSDALAAVSVTGNITYLIFALAGGVNLGSSVVMAQAYGARNQKNVKAIIVNSMLVLSIMAILFTFLGIFFSGAILKLIRTPDEIYILAKKYLLIIFAGTFGNVFYDWIAALLRALGNSFIPFLCLVFSGVLNVFLDILFILGFNMGIEGAALGTVIAQGISGFLCMIYAWNKFPEFHLEKRDWYIKIEILIRIFQIGIPAAIQDSIITFSNIVLQGVLNSYGTIVILAYGIVAKYELICMQIGDALGNSISTFVGQNMGAGKFIRVIRSVKDTIFLNFAGYAIVSPSVFLLAERCIKIFTNNNQAIEVGADFLRVYAFFFPSLGILILFQNFLRSVGDIRSTIWMGICEVIARTLFAVALPFLFKQNGLLLVSPFTWAASMLLGIIFYRTGRWKENNIFRSSIPQNM